MPRWPVCCAIWDPPPPRPTRPIVAAHSLVSPSAPRKLWRSKRLIRAPGVEWSANFHKTSDGSVGLIAVQPDMSVGRITAQHQRTMRTLGRDLKEIRHKLRLLPQVDTAETGVSVPAVRVDMENRNAF